MSKPLFLESIKLQDGIFYNLASHQQRMNRTLLANVESNFQPHLRELLTKDVPSQGLYKCRIVYSDKVESIEYIPYIAKSVRTLSLIEDSTIRYSYKYLDRKSINNLMDKRENADDIIIVQNDRITDTSFANLVFENASGLYTPTSYLLAGTKRTHLLQYGLVKEIDISVNDLCKYKKIHLVNAMLDMNECVVEVNDIFGL